MLEMEGLSCGPAVEAPPMPVASTKPGGASWEEGHAKTDGNFIHNRFRA